MTERRSSAREIKFSCKTAPFFIIIGADFMNKQEGRIRIPSGCAISAVISRDGKRMTGEKIIESMRPMHCLLYTSDAADD